MNRLPTAAVTAARRRLAGNTWSRCRGTPSTQGLRPAAGFRWGSRGPCTCLVWTLTLTLVTQVCDAAPADTSLVDVGLKKQLVVDDLIIASQVNLDRRLGTVAKANRGRPLSFTHQAADGRSQPLDVWPLFTSVYYDVDRQKFRMWHRVSFNDRSRRPDATVTTEQIGVGVGYHRGYSESDDGLRFQLVALLQGLKSRGDTNLVVTIDEHEPDPQHRYKIGYDGAPDELPNGACLAHSADGIHWTPYHAGLPVTYRASDFTNQVYWDQRVQAYRLVTRTDFGWGGGPLAGRVDVRVRDHPLEVRGVRSMLNANLKRHPDDWQLEQHWLLDGQQAWTRRRPPIEERLNQPAYLERVRQQALRRQVYVMTHWIYESVYFGLLSVLEWPTDVSEGTKTDHLTRHERSVENFYIATSRDGVGWDMHWVYAGQPLIPRGPRGAWDKDMVFPAAQIVTRQDKHWIYYGGTNERHGAAEKDVWFEREGNVGLAWLRLDGFVGLEAGDQIGCLTTKPFRLQGKNLEFNLAGSGLRVELLDAAGRPIDGFSGQSARWFNKVDSLQFRPDWLDHADLQPLVGRVVRLRIQLKDARLYAFQVRE